MNSDEEPRGGGEERPGMTIRVIGGGAPAGWERVDDQAKAIPGGGNVVRLEQKEPIQRLRSVEDTEPVDYQQESYPESARGHAGASSLRSRWLIAGGVCVLAAMGVFVLAARNHEPPAATEGQGISKAPADVPVEERAVASRDVSFQSLHSLGDGKEVEMKVMLEPADYYTATLPQDAYHCFKLLSKAGDHGWGYLEKGSEHEKAFNDLLYPETTLPVARSGVPLVLRLRHAKDASSRQFMIVNVVAEGWVIWDTE